ncbi:SAM-dependent methyltransferase [Bacillus sp. V3-13]|uniref:O-methyltransferase n=1 Tax=Bacillus sp. V3-13 TaxID=2053728 RepID=UPI000C77243D|nr:O-methyltransferase [Bacillus sp. V3-13]PLR78055.1 SAM-dependent methyltransferase [Bacillus sp. V3-13]
MLNEELHAYLDELIPERPQLIKELERYAALHHVPIMEKGGMEVLLQLLRIHRPDAILEIGTAIGYSALRMSLALPAAKIVTIERDEARAAVALENFKKAGNSMITLIKGDALEADAEVASHAPFDLIFIDAAKGQYRRFFELYSAFLQAGGLMITDNVLFKGLVAAEQIDHKRTRSLVNKIKDFNSWLVNHPDYDTIILPVGDGIAVSKKR